MLDYLCDICGEDLGFFQDILEEVANVLLTNINQHVNVLSGTIDNVLANFIEYLISSDTDEKCQKLLAQKVLNAGVCAGDLVFKAIFDAILKSEKEYLSNDGDSSCQKAFDLFAKDGRFIRYFKFDEFDEEDKKTLFNLVIFSSDLGEIRAGINGEQLASFEEVLKEELSAGGDDAAWVLLSISNHDPALLLDIVGNPALDEPPLFDKDRLFAIKCVGSDLMQFAVKYNALDLVKFLRSQGWDMKKGREDGRNILHIATEYSNEEVLDALFDRDLVLQEDDSGLTPAYCAVVEGNFRAYRKISDLCVDEGVREGLVNAAKLASKSILDPDLIAPKRVLKFLRNFGGADDEYEGFKISNYVRLLTKASDFENEGEFNLLVKFLLIGFDLNSPVEGEKVLAQLLIEDFVAGFMSGEELSEKKKGNFMQFVGLVLLKSSNEVKRGLQGGFPALLTFDNLYAGLDKACEFIRDNPRVKLPEWQFRDMIEFFTDLIGKNLQMQGARQYDGSMGAAARRDFDLAESADIRDEEVVKFRKGVESWVALTASCMVSCAYYVENYEGCFELLDRQGQELEMGLIKESIIASVKEFAPGQIQGYDLFYKYLHEDSDLEFSGRIIKELRESGVPISEDRDFQKVFRILSMSYNEATDSLFSKGATKKDVLNLALKVFDCYSNSRAALSEIDDSDLLVQMVKFRRSEEFGRSAKRPRVEGEAGPASSVAMQEETSRLLEGLAGKGRR